MTIPAGAVPIPDIVLRIASGRAVKVVWDNEAGGHTFQIGEGTHREFVKVAVPHPSVDLHREAEKLRWAARYLPVPNVLDVGHDGPVGWLYTAGLPGSSAVDPRWVADPMRAVRAIATGLRAMHDRLPVDRCQYTWSAPSRLAQLGESARRVLPDAPPVDRLVVCHGDACAPNTLVSDDGRWCGHVDLGDLGIADRWADLAVATLSLSWNYGSDRAGDWEAEFFAAYGVSPDPARIRYYRQLWTAED